MENYETVKQFNEKNKKRLQEIAKSFIDDVLLFGITMGKVLDLDSCLGFVPTELAKRISAFEIYSAVFSEGVLKVAQENINQLGFAKRISFQLCDETKLPFGEESFDMVISQGAIHTWQSPVKVIDEVARVLKPGGIFYIQDYKKNSVAKLFGGSPVRGNKALYTSGEMRIILGQSQLNGWGITEKFSEIIVEPT